MGPFNSYEVDAALQFLPSSEQGVLLVCDSSRDIPYIKRHLSKRLGEPDRQINNTWYYSGKRVSIAPRRDESKYAGHRAVFYVGMDEEPYISPGALTLWKEAGLCEADVYCLLLREGIVPDRAIKLMYNQGVIT